MKIKVNDFKQYCLDTFGISDGEYIYKFYRNTLVVSDKYSDSSQDSRSTYKKRVYEGSSTKKYKHLTTCVTKFSKDYMLYAVKNFIEKDELGLIASRSLNYFNGFVTNQFEQWDDDNTKTDSKKTSKDIKIITKLLKPTKHSKAFDGSEDVLDNWLYSCPNCSYKIMYNIDECPECGSKLSWLHFN